VSGGSLDYVYSQVDEAADRIRQGEANPIYIAFADHLKKVSKALHDYEWRTSGDTGKGDDIAAIMEVITKSDVLNNAIREAQHMIEYLNEAIDNAESIKEKTTP
jgi:hypothetical protein